MKAGNSTVSEYDKQRVVLFGNAQPPNGKSPSGGDFPDDGNLTALAASFYRHGGAQVYRINKNSGEARREF